ncbi:MAG TPA: transcriptional regulator GcvA [Xanthobacteraceae bacterium]|nr:transcriptional regulator GcvA [Xanthobacteraceae bacterium]
MQNAMPPLTALRAFEAAARHLSLTRAAEELHVTPGALSHQIRGLEEMLGVELFERRVRAIALTEAGKQLYPGLQAGFTQIRDAVASLRRLAYDRVLVISTPPGLTSKWLAPRLYRFANACPDIDARISSSIANANFATDGVDVAVRNLPIGSPAEAGLVVEPLVELSFVPVCSPQFLEQHGPLDTAAALARAPLIHDDTLINRPDVPTWVDWFRAAGVEHEDVSRGLRFNSADHALDATGEGAGVLLAHDMLAYDDLRTGRLVIPVRFAIPSGRGYHFVCPRTREDHPHVQAFRAWLRQEISALDWTPVHGRTMKPTG